MHHGHKKSINWYNTTDRAFDFPIFCPFTPDSKLMLKWKQTAERIEHSSKGKVRAKIVEQGGTPLRSLLTRSAPREDDRCNQEDCIICHDEDNKHLMCHRASKGGVGYEVQCQRCMQENGKISLYHGETSRTLYTRLKEHFQNTSHEKPALLKHNDIFHPNQEPNFKVKAVGFFKDPLSRQVNEGIRINNSRSDKGHLMNSKAEFRQGEVPRVVIQRGLQT